MAPDTPVEALTRELAQYLESADTQGTSKAAQQRHFKATLQRLEPLRAKALSAEIEGLYNVAAWYQLFGYPPNFPSWADPNDARVFAGSRLVSALTSLKKEWKQLDTVPKIRAAARNEIPLPTWPGRDFLDKLVKIAGAGATGYPFDRFLAEFPRFLHTKIGVTHKPQYFRKEPRRCILCPELNDFYDNVVQPWIINPTKPKASSRKRRKTDAAGRSVDTGAQAEDEPSEVELPRRANVHQRQLGQTSRESSAGLDNTESILQSSGFRPQHSNKEPTELDTQIEESELDTQTEETELDTQTEETELDTQTEETELEITNHQSLLEDDSGPQILSDDDDQPEAQLDGDDRTDTQLAGNDTTEARLDEQQPTPRIHAIMASRRFKAAKANQDDKAQKEVGEAFDLLLDDDANPHDDVRWLIDNTRQRISRRRRVEIAKVAVDVAADALAKMSAEVASRLRPNTDLAQAIANTEARLAKFAANEVRMLEQQKMLQALADEMDDDDMCILNTCTLVNEDALVARRTRIERELAELKEWAAKLDEQYKLHEQKKKEVEELEDGLAKCDEALEIRALLFQLATQPSTRGAFEAHVAAMEE